MQKPKLTNTPNIEISIAPMMQYTDRHFRYLARLLSPNVKLYTEMIVIDAILNNQENLDNKEFFKFNKELEPPLAIQLGGSCPKKYAKVAKILDKYNFAEINLNIGCPSDRVQAGKIGACLMQEPNLVAECLDAIKSNITKNTQVTVKSRIGIDNLDSYEFLYNFIDILNKKGSDAFIIHARKAWLSGLNPKQNRTIPKINYDRVYQIKKDFPDTKIIINGEIKTTSEISEHIKNVDGCMLGRAIYNNPYMLGEIEKEFFNNEYTIPSREEISEKMFSYLNEQVNHNKSVTQIIKHLQGLYFNEPNAKKWRSMLNNQIQLYKTKSA